MAEIIPCPVCGSFELLPHSMRIRKGFPHISRVRCLECRVVFADPMATEDELKSFYDGYYEKGNFAADDAKNAMQHFFGRVTGGTSDERSLELRRFMRYYHITPVKGGRFLDVGCGLGRAVFLASLLGYTSYGTELDRDAVEFCQSRIPGVEVHQGDLFSRKFESSWFDYVLLYHVIEHLRNPKDYLREIHRVIRPGGILFIGTPNVDALAYRFHRGLQFLTGRIPAIVDGMEHTVVFPMSALARLVKATGFEIVSARSEGHTEAIGTILKSERSTKGRVKRLAQKVARVNQVLIAMKSQ